MSLLDLPDEVLGLILVKCGSRDVLSMANTCRRLSKVANDIFLWQQLSDRELSDSGLQLPPSFRQPHQAHRREVQLGVQAMKRRLQRLRRILPKITKCKTCKSLTCQQEVYCNEDRVVLDVGSKTTWCLGPNSLWQKHPSVLIGDKHGNCLTCEHSDKLKPQAMLHTKFHGNIRPHSHHQPLLPQFGAQDLVSSFANLRIDGRAGCSSASGVFDDMFNVVKSINPESYLRHPLKCLQGDRGDEGGCTVFEDFISHILKKFQFTQNLQQANSSLVFCEPYFMTTAQRRKLCKFFFESTGAGRVCFLNKAYSTAALTQIETCIVVDSGCHSTVVSVIINGQVQPERTQHRPIGGQHLSENLLDRLRMRQWDCPVSCEGLDNHQVKVSCYLSANIDLEHTTVYDEVFKQCFVQCQRGGILTQEWVEFGSELYIAPELMYTAMQLPDMILKAVRGLPRAQIQQLLTHILLTGANTELTGFRRRLVSDLRRKMPDFAHLNMHTYSGSRSWECCMGGTYLLLANTSDPMTLFPVDSYVSNTYQWITREDYILYGESAVRNE